MKDDNAIEQLQDKCDRLYSNLLRSIRGITFLDCINTDEVVSLFKSHEVGGMHNLLFDYFFSDTVLAVCRITIDTGSDTSSITQISMDLDTIAKKDGGIGYNYLSIFRVQRKNITLMYKNKEGLKRLKNLRDYYIAHSLIKNSKPDVKTSLKTLKMLISQVRPIVLDLYCLNESENGDSERHCKTVRETHDEYIEKEKESVEFDIKTFLDVIKNSPIQKY